MDLCFIVMLTVATLKWVRVESGDECSGSAPFYICLTRARDSWGENLNWENCFIVWGYKKAIIFLISDWKGRAQLIVGGNAPGLVILGSRRKQDWETMRNNSGSGTPPWRLHRFSSQSSWLDFLRRWSMIRKYKSNNPFPPQVAFCYSVLSQKY